MFFVTEISKNYKAKKYLESEFNLENFKKNILEKNTTPKFVSNNFIGTIVEQYLFIKQYKNQNSVEIEAVFDNYKKLLFNFKRDLSKYNHDNVEYFRISSLNNSYVLIYNDIEALKIYPLYKLITQNNSLEKIQCYDFNDEVKSFNFFTLNDSLFIDFKEFAKLINCCIDSLIIKVYSKNKISDFELLKLLYFQNLILTYPYYMKLKTHFSEIEFLQNIHKFFQNHKIEIETINGLLNQNSQNISLIDCICNYQASFNYKKIRGRIDFITNNSILEVKTGKLSKNDLLQVLIYSLIVLANEDKAYKNIKYLKLFYPFQNLIISYDLNDFKAELSKSPEVILDNLIDLLEF